MAHVCARGIGPAAGLLYTGRGHPLSLARDPVFLLVFPGVPLFFFGFPLFSSAFHWFSESVFLSAVSLDSGFNLSLPDEMLPLDPPNNSKIRLGKIIPQKFL